LIASWRCLLPRRSGEFAQHQVPAVRLHELLRGHATTRTCLNPDMTYKCRDRIGVLLRKLPVGAVDRIAGATQRLTVGDLSKYGMPAPERGLYTRLLSEERIPILDVGLIRALKRREVTVVPAVESLEAADVVLEGGRRLRPHAVIAATGFRRGLENLVGHLGVLDEKGTPFVQGDATHPLAPNLYFIGYSNPISGNLRELGIDARRIARALEGRAMTSRGSKPSF
jgi:putative flavoprotein involved in K+ transport